ncbi:MAG TPA: hypothetical protein VEU96_10105 [Bryobacteraceae bacterium]|nr:hypothetical protein [Bryobacteraceae bacterium]
MTLFLKPWEPLYGDRAKYFEQELARELPEHHPLCSKRYTALAKTEVSDDILYCLDDGTYAQVHLTFTKGPPERPGWPGHQAFEALADWMVGRMLADHTRKFGL